LPQLLQLGETEQLAVTLLLTTKYPAEAVIPPRISNRPALVKNSFRFIFQLIFRCAVHVNSVFQSMGVDAPFSIYLH
jgi:hypothetical protein